MLTWRHTKPTSVRNKPGYLRTAYSRAAKRAQEHWCAKRIENLATCWVYISLFNCIHQCHIAAHMTWDWAFWCGIVCDDMRLRISSFPGLPHFHLLFAFTIIHRSGKPAKNFCSSILLWTQTEGKNRGGLTIHHYPCLFLTPLREGRPRDRVTTDLVLRLFPHGIYQ